MNKPRYDADLDAVLTRLGGLGPSLTLDDLPGHRDAIRSFNTDPAGYGVSEDIVEVRSLDGSRVPVSIFNPPGVPRTRPALIHLHGGGMVSGTRYSGLNLVLPWAAELETSIVSVEYRLAPEHPYPAAFEDCLSVVQWTIDHAAEWHIDPARIVLFGGSAGGGLAAAVSLALRDGGGPPLCGLMLMYPMLDDRNISMSSHQFAGTGGWDREANAVGWSAFLGDSHQSADSYAAPARATDVSGLPPMYIEAGAAEVFRDEVVDYANRIWAAAGDAELHVWGGAFHGFDAIAPDAAVSRRARHARKAWLARLITTDP